MNDGESGSPRVQACFMTDYVCNRDSQLKKSLNTNRFHWKPKRKFSVGLWKQVDGKFSDGSKAKMRSLWVALEYLHSYSVTPKS